MFENNNEEINPPFPEKKFPSFPNPPNLQRSVSAPAIAEHVRSDAYILHFHLLIRLSLLGLRSDPT